MNEITDTINNLEDTDKKKVLDTMEENAKNNEDKKRYKQLVHLIIKGLDKLEKNKRIAKENAIKDIENSKLYSIELKDQNWIGNCAYKNF